MSPASPVTVSLRDSDVMTALTWAVRLIIFSFLLVFAIRNTQLTTLRFILDSAWEAPLVIILLAFFAGGAVLGALSVVGVIFRQRREIARLKREAAKPSLPVTREPPPLA
jgi:uncharacterized integral membrane protein